jgi:hypothetical protein
VIVGKKFILTLSSDIQRLTCVPFINISKFQLLKQSDREAQFDTTYDQQYQISSDYARLCQQRANILLPADPTTVAHWSFSQPDDLYFQREVL